MNESRRLGEENICTLLRQFSIPCIMGILIGAFYNIVDQIFIGNSELGYLGNAATGVSFPILCVANAFAFCIGDGAASYLSICAGRNDSQSAHKCVGSGITTTFIIGIVISTVIGIVLGGQPIFGYNYGARRFDRVRENYSIALKASDCVSLAFLIVCGGMVNWILTAVSSFGNGLTEPCPFR